MDLRSGYPFWTVANGLLNDFPALREDLDCDVLVVGAGITGALVAWHLRNEGFDVRVIDRREAGWGSTSASTALLQYENDTELADLAERLGEKDAVLAYRACERAIGRLGEIARQLRGVGFRRMRSLYYASRWYHRRRLLREAALRQAHGFDLKVLDRAGVRRRFGFDAPLALLTEVAAEVDPYRMTHKLLAALNRDRSRVFDRTAMADFAVRRGGVHVRTEGGATIRCRQLVIAAGYECQRHIDEKLAANRSSYALVTEPVAEGLGVLRGCLVWETARPYLYLRSTTDGRLLIGGADDAIDIAIRRDLRVPRKAAALLKQVARLFPDLALHPAFAWAGTFAETPDGLPYFGPHEQHGPRVHFAMAYGGNGITFSLAGAELLRERLAGRGHPCARLFSFDRLRRR
jgi:glycine/D-amino acid oxidase-like deaminating enzyme